MALLGSWNFTLLLLSAIVVASAVPEYSVAETDAEVDKKGYEVKTMLDGNKLGHTFYNIHEDTNGDRTSVIALDSSRSNILRVSLPLSQESVIKRISGSLEGKSGYRDGTTDEALFDHPKKITLDSDGNIYVADPRNGAIRMITRTGFVTTIAGGSNRTGHNDGEGSEVTFSNDFDVTYLHSTCTLAIADRGNRMIREIQLPQFIGRCSNATPDSPGSPIQGATLLMFFLGGIVGILIGVAGTLLTISTRRLEQLQSSLGWTGNNRRPQLGPLIDLEEDNETPIDRQGEGNLINRQGEGDFINRQGEGNLINRQGEGTGEGTLEDSLLHHKKRSC